MKDNSMEGRILLALAAYKKAAHMFDVPERTLRRRAKGTPVICKQSKVVGNRRINSFGMSSGYVLAWSASRIGI